VKNFVKLTFADYTPPAKGGVLVLTE